MLAVESGRGQGDGGFALAPGRTYSLFVDQRGEVDICSGTQEFLRGSSQDEAKLQALLGLSRPQR